MRVDKGHSGRPIWQRLGEFDGFMIKGVEYRRQRSDRHGQLLYETSNPTITAFYDHDAWEKVRKEPGFEHNPNQHDPNRPDIQRLAGVQFISDIPRAELVRMHWLETLIIELAILHKAGGTKLNKHDVQAHIDGEMGARAKEKLKKRQLGETALGRSYVTFDVSGSTLLKKRRDYIAGGFAALRDGRFKCGKSEGKLQPEVQALIALHLASAEGNPSATANSIHDDIRDDIEERNEEALLKAAASADENAVAALEFLRVPDIKTIRRAKNAMDPFRADIGKFGLEVAVQLNPAVRGRPDYLGPLDRVEYDESPVDAITLLTTSGAWAFLTEEEKKTVKRVRMIVGVAICVATRCIVAMRIYPAGNGEETVATFRMLLEDKTKYVPVELRDRMTWPQHGGAGAMVMDQGSSNISDEARTALANLDIPVLLPPAGSPDMRGTGERIFRTFGSEIYRFLDARTGSNVVDRRKYRPETRASLTWDELWKVMVIGVVGIYHNTPHRELDGRTPAYEWERLVPEYGVNALPDGNRHRVTFGPRRQKQATRYGVAFAGQSYTNPLIDHHALHGRGKVEVAGDLEDLGSVSIRLPGTSTWHEAPCLDPDMRGIRYVDWIAACAPQKQLASDDAKARRRARSDAKKALIAIQQNARDRTDQPPPIITDQMVANAERQIFGKYEHAEDDQNVNNGALGMLVEPDNSAMPARMQRNRVSDHGGSSSPAVSPITAKAKKSKWKIT